MFCKNRKVDINMNFIENIKGYMLPYMVVIFESLSTRYMPHVV